MNFYIDTHAHYDSDHFNDDRNEILEKCVNSNIKYVINPATNFESCKKIIELANRYDFLYICLGIHPHDAKEADDKILSKIENMISNKKVVAIGEIGLDYHFDLSPREKQREVFIEFLRIAKKHKLPVVIHSRNSDSDVLSILEKEFDDNLFGQFHCFSGDLQMAKRILEMNFYISFTGVITFSNFKGANLVKEIPLERMLLETDTPYMTPAPFRGKRNDSTFLYLILKKIAEIKSLNDNDVLEQVNNNAIKLFKLPIN